MRVGKQNLQLWIVDSLKVSGGHGTVVQISKYIWDHHESDLKDSQELFYTWQYDVRWAANALRRKRVLRPVKESPKGIWELA
jgi:hypothetical protein